MLVHPIRIQPTVGHIQYGAFAAIANRRLGRPDAGLISRQPKGLVVLTSFEGHGTSLSFRAAHFANRLFKRFFNLTHDLFAELGVVTRASTRKTTRSVTTFVAFPPSITPTFVVPRLPSFNTSPCHPLSCSTAIARPAMAMALTPFSGAFPA